VHIHPDILHAIHRGCSFLEGFERTLKNLLQKGRPFILRRITGHVPLPLRTEAHREPALS
jgi:hypothetical protein